MSDLSQTATFEAEVEFQEDEIWAVIEHSEGTRKNTKVEEGFSSSSSSSRSSNAWRCSKTKPITIPGSSAVAPPQQSSAPVGKTDWSKILQQQKPFRYDDDGDKELPPHEYLAKRLARKQIAAAFSMCEGVEGRGLSRLRMRNAILTKTGFLE